LKPYFLSAHFSKYKAAIPETTGAAIEVPPFLACQPPESMAALLEGFERNQSGAAVSETSPVAETSGLMMLCLFGPLLEFLLS
jgi:hypothetical protein